MINNKTKDLINRRGVTVIIMILLAIISTYVAFIGGRFELNPDGVFHLTRFESVYQALAVGEWPSRLVFIGFEHQGSAITGMYPWLSAWMFILPRFLFSPMWSLMIGFLILNIMTIGFTWALMRRFTTKPLLIWLGVILYQFNGYHFILMYSRVALGEAIGYMALPLVLLGLVDIWNKHKCGLLYLGLGMAVAANGHVLSLVLLTVMVAVFELYRLITKKVDFAEVWAVVKGALVALVLSAYSLFTMIQIMMQNTLMPPTIRWSTPTLRQYLKSMSKNDFQEAANTIMGLGITGIMVVFAIAALWQLKNRGSRWILTAVVIFIGTFDFVFGPEMVNSPLSTLQFSIRVWMFVALFLAVGIVIYLEEFGVNVFVKVCIYLAMIGVMAIAIQGTVTNSESLNNRRPFRTLTNESYERRISWHHAKDYVLRDASIDFGELDLATPEDRVVMNSARMFDNNVKNAFKYKDSTFDSVTWEQNTKKAGSTKLPVVGYAGVDYTVLVNGSKVEYDRKEGHLFVDLLVGKNTIVVSGR